MRTDTSRIEIEVPAKACRVRYAGGAWTYYQSLHRLADSWLPGAILPSEWPETFPVHMSSLEEWRHFARIRREG